MVRHWMLGMGGVGCQPQAACDGSVGRLSTLPTVRGPERGGDVPVALGKPLGGQRDAASRSRMRGRVRTRSSPANWKLGTFGVAARVAGRERK